MAYSSPPPVTRTTIIWILVGGRYWLSDLNQGCYYAYYLRIEISAFNGYLIVGVDGWNRAAGFTIRPVKD